MLPVRSPVRHRCTRLAGLLHNSADRATRVRTDDWAKALDVHGPQGAREGPGQGGARPGWLDC